MPASDGGDLPELTVRLHLKVLAEPEFFSIDEMVEAMRETYRQAGIRVDVISTQSLDLPAQKSIFVGECFSGVVTPEQEALFENRDGVEKGDVVVYFVLATVLPFNGCAVHPAGKPGAVVARKATRWTLAHEVGHVLGLGHVSDTTRLMNHTTVTISKSPPDLSPGEIAIMRTSRLVRRRSP
jgi:Matrixin